MTDELWIFLISAAPVVELRLAIPIGILEKGMSVGRVVACALLGNLIVIIPLLFLLKCLVTKLEQLKGIGRLIQWWFDRVEKKSKIVRTYGFIGLILFVAIPFPGTGAWTGSAAATLFHFKIKRAFVAISIGVVIAAIAVTLITLASQGVIQFWSQ